MNTRHPLPGLRCAATLVLLLTGCAQMPREPLVYQPMSARAASGAASASAPSANGAIYSNAPGALALFQDRRPRSVGDILTIQISENVNATKNSATNVSRSGSASADLGIMPSFMGGLLSSTQNAGVSGKNVLSAKGGANATNTFNGTLTVSIIEVLPNGNLLVSGEKQMLINQGTEYIRFSGIVNPQTVSSTNTVPSTQVADARIEYSAKGAIDEAQQMGWLQRFFLNVLPL